MHTPNEQRDSGNTKQAAERERDLREAFPYISTRLAAFQGLAEVADEDICSLIDVDFDGDTNHTAITQAMQEAATAFETAGEAIARALELIGADVRSDKDVPNVH